MATKRLPNRLAWDHSVLVNPTSRLDWRPPARTIKPEPQTSSPVPSVVLAWVLIAWSGFSAWSLWTRNALESHISMRFLMRGDIEEIVGVVLGLLWACIPAWAAFFLARRAREISMDDVGVRAYWTSLLVSLVAALGMLRPTWDQNAGSRFARSAPASPSTTTSAAQPDPILDPWTNVATAWTSDATPLIGLMLPEAPSRFGTLRLAEALDDGIPVLASIPLSDSSPVPGHWGRARVAALRQALARQHGATAPEALTEVPDSDNP